MKKLKLVNWKSQQIPCSVWLGRLWLCILGAFEWGAFVWSICSLCGFQQLKKITIVFGRQIMTWYSREGPYHNPLKAQLCRVSEKNSSFFKILQNLTVAKKQKRDISVSWRVFPFSKKKQKRWPAWRKVWKQFREKKRRNISRREKKNS